MTNGILRFGLNPLDKGLCGSKELRDFVRVNTKASSKRIEPDSVDGLIKYFAQQMMRNIRSLERTPAADTVIKAESQIINPLNDMFRIL